MKMTFNENTENTEKGIEKNEEGNTVITRQADTVYHIANHKADLIIIHTATNFYTITYDEEPSQEKIDRDMETVIYNKIIVDRKDPILKKFLKNYKGYEIKLHPVMFR